MDHGRALNLAYLMKPADSARRFIVRRGKSEQIVSCVIFHNYELPVIGPLRARREARASPSTSTIEHIARAARAAGALLHSAIYWP